MKTRIFTPLWIALKWAKLAAWKVVNALWKSETTKKIDNLSRIMKEHFTQPKVHPAWFEHYFDWRFREYRRDQDVTVVDLWTLIQDFWRWLWASFIGPIVYWLQKVLDWIKDFYESVIKKIIEWYDKTIGRVVEYWYKVKAFIGTVADIIGIFKPEWKRWIEDQLKKIQTDFIDPIEDALEEVKGWAKDAYDWLTGPLDLALAKIAWLKDFRGVYIDPLKDLIVPTIEAPNLLGEEATIKTTLTYGEEAGVALLDENIDELDPKETIVLATMEVRPLIQYFAHEVVKGPYGMFKEEYKLISDFIAMISGYDPPDYVKMEEATLRFVFPFYDFGKKEWNKIMNLPKLIIKH